MFSPDGPAYASSSVNRADEYRQRVAAVVCRFQQSVERAADCNYDALRAALRWARQTYLPITMTTLRSAYQIACRPSFRQHGAQDGLL